MKRKILLILLSFNIFQNTFTGGGPKDLPKERTHNCIILNDTSENVFQKKKAFFWNNLNITISNKLSIALIEIPSPIICSKSIWANMQYLAQLWKDFAHLSPEDLFERYKDHTTESNKTFRAHIKKYAPAIKAIDEIYLKTNQLIGELTLQKKSMTDIISMRGEIEEEILPLYGTDSIKTAQKYCSSDDANRIDCDDLIKFSKDFNLQRIFRMYLYYRNIDWSKWKCFEINEDYLLFVPTDFIPKTTTNKYRSLFSTHMTDAQMETGLKGIESPAFDPTQSALNLPKASLNRLINMPYFIGKELLDALKKTFVMESDLQQKTDITASSNQYTPWILPSWNIFLGGHGMIGFCISGLSILGHNFTFNQMLQFFTGKVKNELSDYFLKNNQNFNQKDTNSEFNQILQFFAHKVKTKLFTYSSCYPAGDNLQTVFNFTSAASSKYLESIPYTIMALGVTSALTYSSFKYIAMPPFEKYDLRLCVDIPEDKSYGRFFPTDWTQTVSFHNFFSALMQSPPNMQAANNAISGILEEYNQSSIESGMLEYDQPSIETGLNLNSFALIKAPHTEWFTPASFHKEVAVLNQIEAMGKDTAYKIKEATKVLLLYASYIPRIIQIAHKRPIFIPMNLLTNHYYFEEIQAPENTLEDIIKGFFSIVSSANDFTLYIKNLKTAQSNTTYSIIVESKRMQLLQHIKMIVTLTLIENIDGVKTAKKYTIDTATNPVTLKEQISFKLIGSVASIEEQIQQGKIESQKNVTDLTSLKETLKRAHLMLPPVEKQSQFELVQIMEDAINKTNKDLFLKTLAEYINKFCWYRVSTSMFGLLSFKGYISTRDDHSQPIDNKDMILKLIDDAYQRFVTYDHNRTDYDTAKEYYDYLDKEDDKLTISIDQYNDQTLKLTTADLAGIKIHNKEVSLRDIARYIENR